MKSFKKYLYIAIIIMFSAASAPIYSFADNGNTTVHVTKTGSCYHRAGCSYLKSDIAITLKDAVDKGYSPCSRCNPPAYDSTPDTKSSTPKLSETFTYDDNKSSNTSSETTSTNKLSETFTIEENKAPAASPNSKFSDNVTGTYKSSSSSSGSAVTGTISKSSSSTKSAPSSSTPTQSVTQSVKSNAAGSVSSYSSSSAASEDDNGSTGAGIVIGVLGSYAVYKLHAARKKKKAA